MDQDKIFQLGCAIIPGMMARYTKEEKSDAQVIADSILLAQEFYEACFVAAVSDSTLPKKV